MQGSYKYIVENVSSVLKCCICTSPICTGTIRKIVQILASMPLSMEYHLLAGFFSLKLGKKINPSTIYSIKKLYL